MRFGRNLGATLVVSVAAFISVAPAHAGTVCNEAQSSPHGTLAMPSTTDPSPPARNYGSCMPVGNDGAGLVQAASHSPALGIYEPALPLDDTGGIS